MKILTAYQSAVYKKNLIMKIRPVLYLSLLLPCMAMLHFGGTNSAPCTNVQHFGAKGDGLTDDTDAIHQAFAAATTCVCFPPGVYLIDPDSTPSRRMDIIRSGMTVKGVRGKSVLKIKDNSIADRSTSNGIRHEQLLLGNKFTSVDDPTTNVTVQDLIFDCNYRGNQAEVDKRINQTAGVFFNVVSGVTVKNCVFLNAPHVGLAFNVSKKVKIKNNYVYDVAQGKGRGGAITTNGCTDTEISGNLLENVGEGIFCQHFAGNAVLRSVPDSAASIFNNRITTLDVGQVSSINKYISAGTLSKIKPGNLVSYTKAGVARGSSIGILSNNSKAYENTITQHLAISVQALSGQGNQPTSNVEVYNNTQTRNAMIPFPNDSGQLIRNVNGAMFIKAISQTLRNVRIYNNTVTVSFNSGLHLITAQDDDSNTPGILSDITFEKNTFRDVCTDFPDANRGAAVFFQNLNLADPANKNRFINITIRDNILGYARKTGLSLEPCMSGVKIIRNRFKPGPRAAGNAFVKNKSCLQAINQPGFFTQSQLNCLLEPGGICLGCISNPANCPPDKKCASCD